MKKDAHTFQVAPDREGQKARIFVADALPFDPEEFVDHLFGEGRVHVGGTRVRGGKVLCRDDVVTVHGREALRREFKVEALPPEVLYEDEHVLVVNKPAGCTVIRERKSPRCPFQNGILQYLEPAVALSDAAERRPERPHVVHRLDRDTTGAVIVVKSRQAERQLSRQFQERTVEKEYLAVVQGEVAGDEGTVEEPIAPVKRDISRMRIGSREGKPALTRYEVVERFRGMTLVKARPETGRRHQIRVHLAHIGYAIVADWVYGGGKDVRLSTFKRGYRAKEGREETPLIARSALHAHAITFVPVGAGGPVRVEAPLPMDFELLLKMLRKYARGGWAGD